MRDRDRQRELEIIVHNFEITTVTRKKPQWTRDEIEKFEVEEQEIQNILCF